MNQFCRGHHTVHAGKVLAGTCVISLKLLEELKEHSLAVAREAAEAAIQSRRASSLAASTSASGKQTAPVSGMSLLHYKYLVMPSEIPFLR